MILNIDAASNVGLKRKNNEDMILIDDVLLRDGEETKSISVDPRKALVFAVADGMGGHMSGDLASRLVAERIRAIASEIREGTGRSELKDIFEKGVVKLHRELMERSEVEGALRNMGSTLVAVVFYENQLFLINAGDSRCYRFRNELLKQFSNDHSVSAMMGVERSKSKALLNSIGGGDTAFIDFMDVTHNFTTGDKILLCSDGLHDMVEDEAIEKALSEDAVSQKLVQLALKMGGADNISIVLINILE